MSICERALVLAPLCSWIELIWTEWLTEKHIAKSMQWQINNTPLSPHETNGNIGKTILFLCSNQNGFIWSWKEKKLWKNEGETEGDHFWCWILLFLLPKAGGPQAKWNDIAIKIMDNMKNWNPFQPSSQTNKLNACILHIAREKNWY